MHGEGKLGQGYHVYNVDVSLTYYSPKANAEYPRLYNKYCRVAYQRLRYWLSLVS
jgi:hypothetical protein